MRGVGPEHKRNTIGRGNTIVGRMGLREGGISKLARRPILLSTAVPSILLLNSGIILDILANWQFT